MTGDTVELVVGMGILIFGGEMMVRGASRLARTLGVSSLAIGLTVVAFGTSAPELAVNLLAAVRGSGGISFGNIVGSNLANIGLIFGLAAMLRPIPIRNVVIRRELPMMMLATAAAMAMAFDAWLGAKESWFDRGDGIVLLLFFVVFFYYTIGDFLDARRRARRNHRELEDAAPQARSYAGGEDQLPGSPVRHAVVAFAGIGLLVAGAELTVNGAVGVARELGVSEVIIGLTVLAVGTSLPELAACLVAVVRNEAGMAVGNVVGSNIFNLLMVGGITAVVRPIPIPDGAYSDLLMLGLLSVALWLCSLSRGRQIIRGEAIALFAAYLVYIVWRTGFSG